MAGLEYKLELLSVFDPNEDVLFKIEPPVRFLTEEARVAFGGNVINIIARRTGHEELGESRVEVTHDSADGTATLGYARVPVLRYGTGKEVFYQALLEALNGKRPQLYDNENNVVYPGFGDDWKSF